MDAKARVEAEVLRATLHYLGDAAPPGGWDEDLHPEALDREGRALELALGLLEEWKKRETISK